MRKIIGFVILILCSFYKPCLAIDHDNETILSVINLDHEKATREKITAMLGTPTSVEPGKKRTKWHYACGKGDLVIYWKSGLQQAEKIYFEKETEVKSVCNMDIQQQLKNGITDIKETMKLLGIPEDMTIKEFTQIMHYTYQDSMLRLFFRNNKLVDFALVERKN